ncbi:hypothetical protein H0264_00105 [Nocardia huaxiensis]|uniref:Uncharacterized protein n=1 Tax=Nocardia huaxiensis TaxID=2755382 RepID=A0A7D6Z4E3_9NOCA|nr:DUF6463 family protein [Nocardia huaxiensis]QLY30864.1 hypothetical protein H0264_00105 [Nocardia huaxiensis]
MVKWAGRILVFLGAAHTALGLALTAPHHAGAWFGFELWTVSDSIAEMDSSTGAFWMSVGSFGVPLALVGALVLWMDNRGIVPPPFIAWTVGLWIAVAAAIAEPAPWLVAWVAVGLLLAADRQAKPAQRESQGIAAPAISSNPAR